MEGKYALESNNQGPQVVGRRRECQNFAKQPEAVLFTESYSSVRQLYFTRFLLHYYSNRTLKNYTNA